MGKHLNAKQRELEKKLKNQQKGMMYTKSTEAVSVPTLQAASTRAEVSQNTAEASTLITPGTLNTKAKAMGLKSTLVFDDKIVVTSFLNSKTEENEKCAHIEKIAACNGQTIVERPRMFNTSMLKANELIESNIDLVKKFVSALKRNYTLTRDDIMKIYKRETRKRKIA